MAKFEELLAQKLAKLAEDKESRIAYRQALSTEVEEFYNIDHDPETGRFDVGVDGPGRKRDNLKKAEAVLGKRAPKALKNLLTRRLGRANAKAQKALPESAAAYQKALAKRVAEKRVIKGEE